MPSYRDPDFKDRQKAAAAAKKAMLEKHRAAAADPAAAEKQAARIAVIEARKVRTAEREAAVPSVPTPLPSPMPSLRVYPAPSSGPTGTGSESAGLVLDLQARQSCWVAVEADGVKVMDRVLAEGERQTLSARDEIVLSVGNAGGLAYKLNGKPGVMLGREGEVRRNIVITRQSVPSLLSDGPLPPA
jgi:hypothetical protein